MNLIDNFLMFLVLLINKFVYIDISRKMKYNKMLYQGELDLQLNQPTLENVCICSNISRTPFHSNTSGIQSPLLGALERKDPTDLCLPYASSLWHKDTAQGTQSQRSGPMRVLHSVMRSPHV